MSAVSQPSSSPVKSIQRGSIQVTASGPTGTAAISAVTTAKCSINITGHRCHTLTDTLAEMWQVCPGTLVLTSSTLVTLTLAAAVDATTYVTIAFEVVEYN